MIVTDDENSYPEIQEPKKIDTVEWLDNCQHKARRSNIIRTIIGNVSPRKQGSKRDKKNARSDDFDGHGPDLFKCDSDYETASIYLEDNNIRQLGRL